MVSGLVQLDLVKLYQTDKAAGHRAMAQGTGLDSRIGVINKLGLVAAGV